MFMRPGHPSGNMKCGASFVHVIVQLAKRFLREKVRDLWYHGYTSYMEFGAWTHKLVIFLSTNTLQQLSP
jgi:hypothetical protein